MENIHANKKPKLLFVIAEDIYFCSHRLPLALAAIKEGFDVAIATRIIDHADIIRDAGIKIHPWDISRGSINIWTELRALYSLLKIYRDVRPDIVHQVAIKPVLYGTLVAKLVGQKRVVNALGGLGSIFIDRDSKKLRRIRAIISVGLRWLLSSKGSILILQNPDDSALLINKIQIDPKNIRLIRGAGVNTHQFNVSIEPNGVPLVVLPARMLWDKGIGEYVKAAAILKAEGVVARFALVGGIDCNPSGISLDQLNAWVAAGTVEWFGMRSDMPDVFRQANIVCLPSYREGLPKALLEAAACGRAIVTTDVPGCREIVRNGENGVLVQARDPIALADALKKLILEPDLRLQMGSRGREMVLTEFSENAVVEETLDIYKEQFQTIN